MRIFLVVDGEDVTAFEADAVPHIGHSVWFKTPEGRTGTVIVEDVEHQFDRSSPDAYGNHDVSLRCKSKRSY